MPARLRLICQGFFIPPETPHLQVSDSAVAIVLMDGWMDGCGASASTFWPHSLGPVPTRWHIERGRNVEANMLQYLHTSPLSAPVPGSEGKALPANHSEGHPTH